MLIVPTIAARSQVVNVLLGGQNCTFKLYQKSTGFYVDVYVNNILVIGGVIGLDRNLIVRSTYLGFIGDVFFYDTQGRDDPTWDSMGSRFLFCYLDTTDTFNPGPS